MYEYVCISVCVYVFVCMSVYIYVCVSLWIWMYQYVYVYVCVCLYVCLCVCVSICMYKFGYVCVCVCVCRQRFPALFFETQRKLLSFSQLKISKGVKKRQNISLWALVLNNSFTFTIYCSKIGLDFAPKSVENEVGKSLKKKQYTNATEIISRQS